MSLRILLVDDEADGLRMLTKLLGHAGYAVHAARSCAEALELARRRPCDLLIADIGLPDRTGLELMRELRTMYLLPGTVLSGHAEEEFRRDAQAAGFSKYLLKPVQFENLLAAIREVQSHHA